MVTLNEQVDQVINHGNLCFHLARTLALLFCRFHLSFQAWQATRSLIVSFPSIWCQTSFQAQHIKWSVTSYQVFHQLVNFVRTGPVARFIHRLQLFHHGLHLLKTQFSLKLHYTICFPNHQQPSSWSFSQAQKSQGVQRTCLDFQGPRLEIGQRSTHTNAKKVDILKKLRFIVIAKSEWSFGKKMNL